MGIINLVSQKNHLRDSPIQYEIYLKEVKVSYTPIYIGYNFLKAQTFIYFSYNARKTYILKFM